MATLTGGTSNSYVKYQVIATENSYSVASNTSLVTVALYAYRTNTGYTTYGNYSGNVSINGTAYPFSGAYTSSNGVTSSSRLVFSKQVTVAHNADGTKSMAFGGNFTVGSAAGTAVSGSMALTTIPRATTPSVSPASQVMGSAITINTPRAASAFTHTLTYVFGGASGTIASGVGTSYAWTIPESLASQIPNSASGTGTITCYTYNGSTLIGSKAVAFTATVPNTANYQPTITSATYEEATEGLAAKFGAFVQGKSTLVLAMVATGAVGSTISSYKIQLQTAAATQIYTVANATSNPIVGSGDITITYTATDSRGRSVSETLSDEVLAYSIPTITGFNVKRVNQSGVEDDQGAYALATISASITPLDDNNNKQFLLQYKKTSEDTWSSVDVTPSGYSLDGFTQQVANINTDNAYNFQIVVTDYFSSSAMQDMLSTAFTIMDFRGSDGKAIAFGGVAKDDSEAPAGQDYKGFQLNMEMFHKDAGESLRKTALCTKQNMTLSASGWNTTTKQYVITDSAITATNDVDIDQQGAWTAAQRSAYLGIGIWASPNDGNPVVTQAEGQITLTATTVPTVDIPITLILWRE